MRRVAVLVGLAVAAASLVACGGGGAKPDRTIAFLRAVGIKGSNNDAVLGELADAGWKEGDNLTILARDPEEAHPDPADAAKTLRKWKGQGVDLVVALSTTGATTARAELPGVPVVFLVNDPKASGLVADERKPEGNLTGVTFRVPADRTLEVAASLGAITKVGLLWPSNDAGAKPVRAGLVAAAKQLKVDLIDEAFTGDADVPAAVQRLADGGAQVIILANAPTTVRAFGAISAAVGPTKIPVVVNTACSFAVAVLAPDVEAINHQLGRQAVRLLGGTDVADVPVEDPGSFTLTVHKEVAKRIGFEVPEQLVTRADDVTGA